MTNAVHLTEAVLRELEVTCSEVVRFNFLDQAKLFVREFGPAIEGNKEWSSLDLKDRYERLLAKNRYVLLGSLKDKTIAELLLKRFDVALEVAEDLDLQSLIELKLLSIPIYEERDVFKKALREALLQNDTNTVTENPITVQGRALKPTVRNWILDYVSQVGNQVADIVKRSAYFANSQNIRPLSDTEKKRVKVLLDLYEELKLSSLTPEGLEDAFDTVVDDKLVTFVRGKFEPIDPSIERLAKDVLGENSVKQVIKQEDSVASIAAMTPVVNMSAKPLTIPSPPSIATVPPPLKTSTMQSPPPLTPWPLTDTVTQTGVPATPSRLFDVDVSKQGEEWQKQNVSGVKIFDLLFNAIQQKDKKIILAGLQMLAESGELLTVLKTDSRFYYLLANYYRHQKRLNDLKEFHMSFADPKYVKELTRYILNEQLKLSEDEAAHIGVDLVNMMRGKEPKLKHWAYFDMKTSAYKWL